MLLVPMTTRVNFWVMKFTSLVALEQLNSPNAFGLPAARTALKPLAVRSSASSQVAGRSAPFSRTIGCVSRVRFFRISDHLPSCARRARKTGSGTYMMPFPGQIGSGEPATSQPGALHLGCGITLVSDVRMDPAHEMAHDQPSASGRETWRLAVAATLHCLT